MLKKYNDFVITEGLFDDSNRLVTNARYKMTCIYHPETKEELIEIIEKEIKQQGPEADLNMIDTSLITNMSRLFDNTSHSYAKDFNGDVSKWDVSKVTDMYSIFYGCESFNSDLSKWDVGNVRNMNFMFWGCKEFNQDLGKWNTENVKKFSWMFHGCEKFDHDISKWDMSKMEYMFSMFDKCPIRDEYKPKFK